MCASTRPCTSASTSARCGVTSVTPLFVAWNSFRPHHLPLLAPESENIREGQDRFSQAVRASENGVRSRLRTAGHTSVPWA